MVRLQKFLAEAGVASRRAAERIILDGRVAVNGKPVRVLGTKIDALHDSVSVDGKSVRSKRKIHLALNKPRRCVCSRNDERGRATIYDSLPVEWRSSVYSVGRLDYDTEGLIFLTNDGEFALHLTHPRYGVRKRYLATVEGRLDNEVLKRIEQGVWNQQEILRAERTRLISSGSKTSLAELELTEGKNREVRRLFESQGLPVKRLQRIQIGKIKLGELKTGRWRALTESEIRTLLS